MHRSFLSPSTCRLSSTFISSRQSASSSSLSRNLTATPVTTFTRSFRSTAPMSENMSDTEASRLRDLQTLLSKFRDPQSPYYIPPGARGPSDENDHSTSHHPSARERPVEKFGQDEGYKTARADADKAWRESGEGWDERGRLEWPVAWGDRDVFQHANNVQFVKWFESARIRYTETLDLPADDLKNLLAGKGMGIILKDISIKYKAPVNYPDTLLIATRPHSVDQDRASFGLASSFYSLAQNKVVATADSTIVMYDYDHLCKGKMTDLFRDALLRRIKQ